MSAFAEYVNAICGLFLSTNLHLNVQEEYEAELEGRLARRRAASEREAELLNQRIRQLVRGNDRLVLLFLSNAMNVKEQLQRWVVKLNVTISCEVDSFVSQHSCPCNKESYEEV